MDAGADDPPALAHGLQSERHKRADRRVDDRGVEFLRRAFVRSPGPVRAQRTREPLRLVVARAREREDAAALPERHLRHDVGCGAEPVDAQPRRIAGHLQRAPADEAGAEQRRHMRVVHRKPVGDRQAEARVRDHMRRVAAIARIAREQRRIAEVFAARPAIGTCAARVPEPRHADALALREALHVRADALDASDDLVARHDRPLAVQDRRRRRGDRCGRRRRRSRAPVFRQVREQGPAGSPLREALLPVAKPSHALRHLHRAVRQQRCGHRARIASRAAALAGRDASRSTHARAEESP